MIFLKMKTCSKCLVNKEFVNFHKHKGTNDGYCTICKECRKPISKIYRVNNRDSINAKQIKKYYENHEKNLIKDRLRAKKERKKRLENAKKYYENNKNKIQEYQKKYYLNNVEKIKEKTKLWYNNNKEKANKYFRERIKIKKKEDVLYKLKIKLRSDIYISLKRRKKSKSIEQILGLTLEDYKKHIENQFENWMTWKNWGKDTWHIDHIVPLCSAKNEDEIYKLWHYTNLRPLSAQENLRKGGKFDFIK